MGRRQIRSGARVSGKLFKPLVLLFAVCLASPSRVAANRPIPPSTSPQDVVRQFYSWYLKARFPEPKQGNLATFRKYATQRFLKRAMDPNVDAVVFIDAQDSDLTWTNRFSVAKATIHGQTATTEITLTAH